MFAPSSRKQWGINCRMFVLGFFERRQAGSLILGYLSQTNRIKFVHSFSLRYEVALKRLINHNKCINK